MVLDRDEPTDAEHVEPEDMGHPDEPVELLELFEVVEWRAAVDREAPE